MKFSDRFLTFFVWQFVVFYVFWPSKKKKDEKMTYKQAKQSLLVNSSQDDRGESDSVFDPKTSNSERSSSEGSDAADVDVGQQIAFQGMRGTWNVGKPKPGQVVEENRGSVESQDAVDQRMSR